MPVTDCGTFLTRFYLLLRHIYRIRYILRDFVSIRFCVNFNCIDFVYDNTAYGQCAILR